MTDGRYKVFGYVARMDQAQPALLVFESLGEPGFEVPSWLDITPDLHSVLVQGCNAFVNELLEHLKRGGSDAT